MSEDKEKAKKAAKASAKRASVRDKKSKIRSHQTKKNTVDDKLKRLRTAKQDLNKAMQAIKTQKKQFTTLEDFSGEDFSGDRKDKYERALREAINEIDKILSKHTANKMRIDAEIIVLEGQSLHLSSVINLLSDAVNVLMSEIASLV